MYAQNINQDSKYGGQEKNGEKVILFWTFQILLGNLANELETTINDILFMLFQLIVDTKGGQDDMFSEF